MRRVTRNSNGANTSKLASGNSPQNGPGRMHLSNATSKRNRVKKSREGTEGGGSETTSNTSERSFDFSTEVTFKYSARQNGFGTVLEFMRSGNEGVKEKILNECNIILECRVCNNLFRSPSDFITHKDKHCSEKYERLSPAGLTELLRLAHNSFKVNESVSSVVSLLPQITTSTVSGSDNLHNGVEPDGDLSFDVNHLVPMLKTVLHPCPSNEKSGVQLTEQKLQTSVIAEQTNAGISRTKRQLKRGSNGEVGILGKYKSQKSEKAALLGPDGKAALVGKPSKIQMIVDRLTAQWESKLEDDSRSTSLKCHVCQTSCPSQKSLRNHVRNEHQPVSNNEPKKRRRRSGPLNGISKEMTKMLLKKKKQNTVIPPGSKVIYTEKRKRILKPKVESNKSKLVEPVPSEPIPVTPMSSNAVIENKGKAKTESKGKTTLANRVAASSSFRRLTNNSFCATLATSPEAASIQMLPSLQQLEPLQKKLRQSKRKTKEISPSPSPSVNGNHPPVEEMPDYRAMAKALFVTEKKARKNPKLKSTSIRRSRARHHPKILSCLKCSAEFKTEKQMSTHLGNCHGSQNSINKIGIIDRHDYLKGQAEVKEEVLSCLPFNNNENEVGESLEMDCSKDVQLQPSESLPKLDIKNETETSLDMNGSS